MICPNCKGAVLMRSCWQATGLAGVVCPNCHASLWPTYARSVMLLVLSFLAGNFEGVVLRRAGYGLGVVVLGSAVTLFVVSAALAPFILRLRLKEESPALLPHRK